jgi:cytochrome c556
MAYLREDIRMKMIARYVGARLLVAFLGVAVLPVFAGSGAGQNKKGENKKVNKAAQEAVLRMADAVQRKDFDAVKREADAVAKSIDGLNDVMNLLRLRSRGGLGLGDKPGAVSPDGMEAKLVNMAKRPFGQPQLAKEAKELVRMAYVNAAIAQVSEARTSVDGTADPKAWQKWSADMRQASLELADAAQAVDAGRVKAAAKKLNSSCTECHDKFR